MEHIAVGLVESHKVLGSVSIYPESVQSLDPLQSMPSEGIVDCIRQQVEKVARGEEVEAIGIGFPGIIKNGVIEDSPNFQQAKGFSLQAALSSALSGRLSGAHVHLFNDADVMAAGIAATQGKLNKLIRVGRSATASVSAASLPVKASGKVATLSSLSIQRKISAAVAAAGIWKAFSGAAPCACVFWISNPKKFLKTPVLVMRAARNS